MNSSPRVTVIIPCYNAAEYISETISSVLSQSLQDLELIVVDDGSTDGSEELVRGFTDERIRYVYQPNSGVSAARNRGIHLAGAPLVAFLDADDLYLESNLERKVQFLEANQNYGLVYSAEIAFDSATGERLYQTEGRDGWLLHDLLEFRPGTIHSPSSVVVRRSLLHLAGLFDTNLSTSADWELFIRLASLTAFGYLPEALVAYRCHPGQMHHNIALMERDTYYTFHKAYGAGLFKGEKHYRYCRAKLNLILGLSYAKDARRYWKGLRHVFRSLLLDPRPLCERFTTR